MRGTGSVLVSDDVKDSKKAVDETGDANQNVAGVGTHALDDVTESVTVADVADEKTEGTHHDAGGSHVQAADLVREFLDNIVEAAYATGAKNEATEIRAAAIKMQSRSLLWGFSYQPILNLVLFTVTLRPQKMNARDLFPTIDAGS